MKALIKKKKLNQNKDKAKHGLKGRRPKYFILGMRKLGLYGGRREEKRRKEEEEKRKREKEEEIQVWKLIFVGLEYLF